MPGRQDLSQITMECNGKRYGKFDTRTGGETSATDAKRRTGRMGGMKSYGGNPMTSNVIISRAYEDEDIDIVRELRQLVGRGRCTVSDQPLDQDRIAVGRADVYTGILVRVTPPDKDTDSEDVAMWEAEISTEGTVG